MACTSIETLKRGVIDRTSNLRGASFAYYVQAPTFAVVQVDSGEVVISSGTQTMNHPQS
jgi:hypothetical protein